MKKNTLEIFGTRAWCTKNLSVIGMHITNTFKQPFSILPIISKSTKKYKVRKTKTKYKNKYKYI